MFFIREIGERIKMLMYKPRRGLRWVAKVVEIESR